MDGEPAKYLGRVVSKNNFRAFIYAPHGGQRLVESWEEFESSMLSGLWFATKEDASASVAVGEEYPKSGSRPKRLKKDENGEKDDFFSKD